MGQRSGTITVQTTPTLLTLGADNSGGVQDLIIKNTGSVVVYVGGPAVTTAGFPLAVGDAIPYSELESDSLPYGIVASGTGSIAALQVGV
jgi:hypothetical protein